MTFPIESRFSAVVKTGRGTGTKRARETSSACDAGLSKSFSARDSALSDLLDESVKRLGIGPRAANGTEQDEQLPLNRRIAHKILEDPRSGDGGQITKVEPFVRPACDTQSLGVNRALFFLPRRLDASLHSAVIAVVEALLVAKGARHSRLRHSRLGDAASLQGFTEGVCRDGRVASKLAWARGPPIRSPANDLPRLCDRYTVCTTRSWTPRFALFARVIPCA